MVARTSGALIQGLLKGDRASLARLISKIENRDDDLADIIAQLYPHTGRAQVWGVTGPPGAGKSTLVDGLITRLRAEGKRVAVIAVDPSSPFSGGAILGDRIRMQRHSGDGGVYIRSVGTRGKHGGLSHATKEVVFALDAAGFDRILVETAGVGQTELGILRLAQSVLVVLVPESGDSIQVMKAGLMEIADVFAVNKSDRPEADKLVKELIQLAHDSEARGWRTPVHKTEAIHGKGLDEVIASMALHQSDLHSSGRGESKTREFLSEEVVDILGERLLSQVMECFHSPSGQTLMEQMLQRKQDPYDAAGQIWAQLKSLNRK